MKGPLSRNASIYIVPSPWKTFSPFRPRITDPPALPLTTRSWRRWGSPTRATRESFRVDSQCGPVASWCSGWWCTAGADGSACRKNATVQPGELQKPFVKTNLEIKDLSQLPAESSGFRSSFEQKDALFQIKRKQLQRSPLQTQVVRRVEGYICPLRRSLSPTVLQSESVRDPSAKTGSLPYPAWSPEESPAMTHSFTRPKIGPPSHSKSAGYTVSEVHKAEQIGWSSGLLSTKQDLSPDLNVVLLLW